MVIHNCKADGLDKVITGIVLEKKYSARKWLDFRIS
jgi:hypothetical protein